MRSLLTSQRIVDHLSETVGRVAAWCVVAAIIVSTLNAILRKMGISSNAWLELQWYLFGAVFMLSSAWTLKDNEHVRVDVVYSHLSKRTRDGIDLFGHIFFLLPFACLMIGLSGPYFMSAFISGEHSGQSGGLLIWPARGIILLGFVLLGLQCLSEIIKHILVMRGIIVDEAQSKLETKLAMSDV